LRERRDTMLEALDRHFPPEASWTRPEGGYFLWVDLPPGQSTADLLERATAAGVPFVPGADFYPAGSGRGESSARLAFSFASPAEIAEGVERLASLLPAGVSS
jgi:2-aminoadipate transaminase